MGLKPETTTGGNALKFYASQRYDVRRNLGGADKRTDDSGEMTGNKTTIKVVKNKIAPPFKTVEVDIEFGKGFDATSDLINLAVENGIIEKSGAWYAYKNAKIGQGLANAKDFLNTELDIKDEIKAAVLHALYTGEIPV